MGGQIDWGTVPDLYKRADGVTFEKTMLEKLFPSKDENEDERKEIWKMLDNNGNGSVSLAEFDGWFNKHLVPIETKAGLPIAMGFSAMYTYAKPCFIRAFNLANGVSDAPSKGADDYVTYDEFQLLMVATQVALIIYRLFDIADESDDRRVEQAEWDNQLPEINKQLTDFGYKGPKCTSEDFATIDGDGGGMILLNEAVVFFLSKFTDNKALNAENKKEGTGAAPPPKIAPNVGKRQVMSREEKAMRAKMKKMQLEQERQQKMLDRASKKAGRK